MPKWKSNGDHSSPNEWLLRGKKVILVQKRTVVVGTLQDVKARTRGNVTLAVTWGPGQQRNQPIWLLREHPFTLEPAPACMADGRYHHSILDYLAITP